MSLPRRRRPRPGRFAQLRRTLAVLAAGVIAASVLTLTVVDSGRPGSAGAVQPTAGPASIAAGSAEPSSPGDLAGALIGDESPSPAASPRGASTGGASVGAFPGTGSFITGPAVPRNPPPPIPAAKLQARLDAIRAKYALPGVSATIIWPDGRVWTGVSGWADVGHHVKVVPGTAFSIGSVSKTFMATLVLELMQEGRLSLDDPVRRWLPTANVSPQVTIRELLDHTSGLYDFFENPRIDPALLAKRTAVWTPAQALSYMSAPYCAPGTCWAYSNSNYVLLGQIVARVMGDAPTTELRDRFFGPLGLSRTFVQSVEAPRGPVATAYELTGTIAHRGRISLADGTGVSPFTSVVTAAGTAGDIASSSVDLATWARALYGGKVLWASSLGMMLDTSRSTHLHAPEPYGFAEATVTLGGRVTYGHNGRLVGSRTSIRYLPASGFTIAVVTNQELVGPDVFGTSLMNIAIASLTAPAAPASVGPATSPAGKPPLPSPGPGDRPSPSP